MTGLFAPTESPEFSLGFVLFLLSMSDDKMPQARNESKTTKGKLFKGFFLCVAYEWHTILWHLRKKSFCYRDSLPKITIQKRIGSLLYFSTQTDLQMCTILKYLTDL